MNLQKLISTIKKKIISPRIYAIELLCRQYTHLTIQIAYTFEEAFSIALKNLKETLQDRYDRNAVVLGKYVSKDIHTAITESTELVMLEDEIGDKNVLMRKILETKNVELYHENLSIFTESEKKLLNEKLTHVNDK
jgi:hypothetical protein